MVRIGVLVSGGGTNLQQLIDAQARGELGIGRIVTVISSKPGVYALERAKNAGIEAVTLSRKDYPDVEAYSQALIVALKEREVDLVVLSGFLTITSDSFVRAFPNRVMNVHPALLPAFGGKGYYGLHVHEAVLRRGCKLTGATVHFANEVCDGGPIILQKAVEVQEGDSPESLQKRVMEQAEWQLLPQAVALFCQGRLAVEEGTVFIAPARDEEHPSSPRRSKSMKTKDAKVERFHLDAPMHMSGLSLAGSDLPPAFESLGILWDRFHTQLRDSLPGAVQPAVEVGVSLMEKDYMVGGQTASPGQGPGLASFTIPAGDYVKGSFSADSFGELVDGKLQTIWEDMSAWAKEQGLALGCFSAEIYPQDTVSLPRPSMYCLCPIQSTEP
ncbi:MAG: phosphoribosylglycinamide formyltransferase [Acutalibacter sp.]|nr:phosphoribosylglycinamide formyltransferase [Acutalibacter sp.]